MEYRGNPSLPKEIKDRILTTFQQTLQSAREANYQEAMLGCDFILRLDPDFKPAQQLTERLKQVAGEAAATAEPEIPPEPPPPGTPQAPEPTPAAPADLEDQMRSMLEERRLKPLMELAKQHRQSVLENPDLRRMVEQAQSRIEAEPYLANLVQSGRQMLENAQLDEVDALLSRGRDLDPTHPQLRDLDELRQAMTASQPESVGADTGPLDLSALEESTPEDPLGALSEDPFSLGGAESEPTPASEAPDPFSPAGEEIGADPGDPFGSDTGAADPFALDQEETASAAADPFGGEATPEAPAADPFALDSDQADPFSLEGDAEAEADDPFASFGEESAGSAETGQVKGSEEASFGLDTGSAGGEDGDSRIADLMNEGQGHFDQGDYQGAIDAWSRIFLIDIDHGEATQRIEKARNLKAEQERQVEEIFYEGMEQLKGGQLDQAQESFRKVLDLQPGHTAAQEYLGQLEAGEVPELTGISAPPSGPDTTSVPTPEEISGGPMADIRTGEVDELKEDILVPPDFDDLPGGMVSAGGVAGDKPPAKDSSQARRKFVLIGSGVLLLVVVLGGYAWLNRDQWFPNSDAPQGQSAQPLQMPKSPVVEAKRLHSEGKTDQALKQLKLLPPDSAYYEEAQPLIAQWEAEANPQATLGPEVTAQREQLLTESAQFVAAGEMLAAQEALLAAGELAPLEGEAIERMAQLQQNLAPLQTEIAMVREGEWELARPRLRVLFQDNPSNRDVVHLLGVCHYNQGVQALQRANLEQAAAHFSAVLDLEPEDLEAQRHFRFAEAYQQRERDILFRTYVKYIPFR